MSAMPDGARGSAALVKRGFALAALLALIGAGCGPKSVRLDALPSHSSSSATARPSALAFFNHPLVEELSLSPDGEHIAGVSSRADSEVLLVRQTMGGRLKALAEIVRDKNGEAMTISRIGWPADDRVVMVVEEPLRLSTNHSRRDRLFSADLQGNVRHLAKSWDQSTQIYNQGDVINWLPDDPRHLLVGVIMAGEIYPTVVRVNVWTGAYRVVQEPIWGISEWYADHQGRVRAALGFGKPRGTMRDDKLFVVFAARSTPDEEFRDVVRWNPLNEVGFTFAEFTPDPERLFVVFGSPDGDRDAIGVFDLAKNEFADIRFEHPVVDVTDVVVSQLDGRPLYVSLMFERPEVVYLDAKLEKLQARVDEALPNRVNRFADFNRDESRMLVRSWSDVAPPEYYLFDGANLSLLLQAYPDLIDTRMSAMQPIEYRSRDGLTIRGYWTRPVDAPAGPVATIVLPHGGPWARDVWGWDPVVQFLASRGFAVFQPNFRGSTGYGTEFREAGYGQWGLGMQNDITDGVRWLIQRGMADPERIGIFGMSFGGYAALQGLVSTPELYKAGASLAGVTDVRLFMSHVGQALRHDDMMRLLVGNRRTDKKKLAAASPVENVDEIRVPVLLGHGTRDWNVRVEHSKNMARALRKHDVPVELYIYDDEPHVFLDDRNLAHFFTKLAEFFERHLQP
ncbi:MAG: S9 family peptidase [Myxococcales bacterium]|nr:S9 family peptidase [Deltaproteobacteria bacterium]NNL24951.1 S9 family peptidase [Myxococcales bacterium]